MIVLGLGGCLYPPQWVIVAGNWFIIDTFAFVLSITIIILMNFLEQIRTYCLSKPCVSEGFPFDEDTLVFKVAGKMFCLTSFSEPDRINLKCDPELAVQLRERYPCVLPGYHMNKKMWNTVLMDGSIPPKKLFEWIDHSYNEVVRNLTKKKRVALGLG